MATEKDIKKELLSQLEIDTPESPKEEYTTEKILKKYKNQLKRLKKYAIISWIVTVLYLIVITNLKDYLLKNNIYAYLSKEWFWLIRYSDISTVVFVLISILFTYLVYYKSKTLTMLQICTRLANIENYLKKISPDK